MRGAELVDDELLEGLVARFDLSDIGGESKGLRGDIGVPEAFLGFASTDTA
jgi:hypothetical protein